ncbi:MAG TPA: exodeoxyribonuclease III [Alphaproteobacteria bacterium]|nr:exodeoxyribonuclease III [Alphaproteobacteria bacterium]
MRIATWNINSVRLRIGIVERLIDEQKPDVICLQETKTVDETFPREALAKKGYKHQHIAGMKSYNGVAILSRLPLTNTGGKNWQGKEDCRHIFAELPNGIEVHNCYVPAGGDIPDPKANPKFAHKLGFLDEKAAWWKSRKDKKQKILVGDLNVAPMEHDVWSHKQMLGVVSHTPIEVEKLTAWQKAHNWYDAVRHFTPAEEKLYSWWSYRAADWRASDRGRRLDHIWVTPGLTSSLKKAKIIKDARGWDPKPSDHVPVLIDIA